MVKNLTKAVIISKRYLTQASGQNPGTLVRQLADHGASLPAGRQGVLGAFFAVFALRSLGIVRIMCRYYFSSLKLSGLQI